WLVWPVPIKSEEKPQYHQHPKDHPGRHDAPPFQKRYPSKSKITRINKSRPTPPAGAGPQSALWPHVGNAPMSSKINRIKRTVPSIVIPQATPASVPAADLSREGESKSSTQ